MLRVFAAGISCGIKAFLLGSRFDPIFSTGVIIDRARISLPTAKKKRKISAETNLWDCFRICFINKRIAPIFSLVLCDVVEGSQVVLKGGGGFNSMI